MDAHVGKHIFERCIRGALAGRTVLFVTHQLQVVSINYFSFIFIHRSRDFISLMQYLSKCDHVVYMMSGTIAGQGTVKELCSNLSQFQALLCSFGNSVQTQYDHDHDQDQEGEKGIHYKEDVEEAEEYSEQKAVHGKKNESLDTVGLLILWLLLLLLFFGIFSLLLAVYILSIQGYFVNIKLLLQD